MEIKVTPEVESLFAKYEQYVQKWDFKGVARLYGSKLVAASPQDIAFHRNNFITRWQFDKAMNAFYGKAKLSTMRIVDMREFVISDNYSLVTVTWSATFKKEDLSALEFHISYLVRKKKRGVEIVLFIAHEDEGKILEGYGLISR